MDQPKPAPLESLAGKLQRIEDLIEKLVYIKWSRESFVLLQHAAQDILKRAQSQSEDQKLADLAERLDQQIGQCLQQGELPKGIQRQRLIAIAEALCRCASSLEKDNSTTNTTSFQHSSEPATGLLFSKWGTDEWPSSLIAPSAPEGPIWLVAPESMQDVAHKLKQRGGFEVVLYPSLAEIRKLLAESQQPIALIIDLDHLDSNAAIMQQIGALRQLLKPDAPILFVSERGDINARLEAVEVGAVGYFTKPVNVPLILETIEKWISSKSSRVLIVDDMLPAARDIARRLEMKGMAAQVLAQPLQILQALANFQPSLLIMSLDLKEIDGIMLAEAIQQHERFRAIPLILLSAQRDINQRLSNRGLSGEVVFDKTPDPQLLLATVSKRLRQSQTFYRKLSQIDNRDTVTRLYNRPYFLSYLDRALVAMTANAQSLAVILITLDNLRIVDGADVAAADQILEHAAKRLQVTLGSDAIIAHFSDAVFTILLAFTSQDALLATARALQTNLEVEPYPLNNGEFQIRTSVGISIANPNPNQAEATLLIQQADLACGMARDSKDTRIYVHHSQPADQERDTPRQRQLLEEIRDSVQQKRMNLLFQPIVSLRGDPTERYEVLLRLRNREGWELLPETVFGLVKRHRIGIVLDRWVIAHSIRTLRERQARGRSTILFINISPTILQDEELINWLKGGLEKTQVPPASVVFEIAETTAELNKTTLLPFLRRLKELGCGLSLDRFSGHERALALAQQLQADYVKLDGRYAQDLLNDKARQHGLSVLVRSLTAQSVTTILTGIENSATLPILWSCGIDYVQGFLLQRPHTDMSFDFEHVVL
jgi:diguanylate cyclase (GGDEF)-like protein